MAKKHLTMMQVESDVSQQSMNPWFYVAIVTRGWSFFFTTPDLLDKPKSFILDHAFCFFSFSTLSTLPSMFFFGGGIPINLHLHLRCYFWPWSWWIVPYTLGIEATAGTKKTPWPRQHPKPWRLPQWRWPWSWGWKQNRVFVGGFGKDSGCVLYFFKMEIKLERRHMCRGRF